ncbi:iron-containing alcohol dehydrogenase family protein [Kutzneria buriramensis]|uniref:Alcohol dehydrogenase/alcohol dehydrogenase n=1 Tax=Kutzneria buriramensis TaxID=1045776 RepID=A0A3E0HFR5_9PSEU|nr:iron-containing alcohol dehydrogenase [Kutzneria buriramensis]REH44558.1 alcohol dehydrogenase/alcohol dehydrogenase [Kutzneria buriramensis]
MSGVGSLSIEPTARVEFGPGVVQRLPEFVADLGFSRAFVVTDRGLRAAGIVDRVVKVLDPAGVETAVYEDISPNPSTVEIDRGAAGAREFGSAVIIALGGGSPLDAAKGISLLVGNASSVAADADSLWDAAPGLPLIAVPTTSGTGAETNGFGVIEDAHACRKVYIGHSSVRPRIAVLDPELTLCLPARVTAATGIDALVHGVESLASRGANAFSRAYAFQAVSLVSRWLPTAYRDGSDLEARSQLMLGAHLAGRALTISGLGLVHGIGHAITAHTGTPHGIALAAVFEDVMRFSLTEAADAYAEAARAMGVEPAADAAIDSVQFLCGVVDVRRPLRDLGATTDLLPSMAAAAVADAVTKNTPRLPTEPEVLELLHNVY